MHIYTFQNNYCRYELGADGRNQALVNLATRDNFCRPSAFMAVGQANRAWESTGIKATGDALEIVFGDSNVRVTARVLTCSGYFVVEILDVAGDPIDWLEISRLKVTVNQSAGNLINAVWDNKFAVCVLACNDLVDCGSHGILSARAYKEFGFKNAKIAFIGVPAGALPPSGQLLDIIETVELEQGLPHPTINGKWIKRAPERFDSYLMVGATLSEENVDQVIEFARGGFGAIEFFPFASTPSYIINPRAFPHGLAGVKKTVAKIHAAGLRAGLHVFQGMPWTETEDNDAYLTPVIDSRFVQDRRATLAAALAPGDTEIQVAESTADWPEQGHLNVAGEVISYCRREARGFAGCARGVHGTRIIPHARGTRLGYLVNSFTFFGSYKYVPDITSTLFDEIRNKIVAIFNATDIDMTYFDAGEEWDKQPPPLAACGPHGPGSPAAT